MLFERIQNIRKESGMGKKKEKKQNGYFRHMAEAIRMELREHKSSFMVYLILRILVIVMLVLQILNQNYENAFLCILTLLLLIIPSFVQVTFKIELPTTLEIIVLLFIFGAEILGEIAEFYLVFPFWDTVLHTLNGFLAAAIGFSLVDLLNRSERTVFHLSPLFTAIVAFCFSMTIGVVWEFFEFGMDQIQEVMVNGQALGLGGYLDIGLVDTMEDLFVNFIGAAVFSVIGFFYVRSRGKGVAGRFIPRKKRGDRDFLKIAQEKSETESEHKEESVSEKRE